jgi:hypothetical protein
MEEAEQRRRQLMASATMWRLSARKDGAVPWRQLLESTKPELDSLRKLEPV